MGIIQRYLLIIPSKNINYLKDINAIFNKISSEHLINYYNKSLN